MNSKSLKVHIILLIGFFTMIFSSCSDNPGPVESIPYFKVSSEFANYCWFDSNSYWVFQDDTTLTIDTVSISNVLVTKRFHTQPIDYNYQAVEMFISSNLFTFSEYELTAGNYEVADGEMNSLLRLYKSDGSYQLVFLPQYPFGEEVIMGDEIGTYTNIEKVNSFWLNDIEYSNVYHTRVVITNNNSVEYDYWIAKNHGIIKAVSNVNGQTSSVSLKSDNVINHIPDIIIN